DRPKADRGGGDAHERAEPEEVASPVEPRAPLKSNAKRRGSRYMANSDLTYSTYLKLVQLLDLQQPRSQPPEHDEMLFIIVHQAYELWFKLQLHEFEKIKRNFTNNHLYGAIATFKRTRTIMKTMVEQVDIVETLTPMSFSSFRDRLENASGFQSLQFREFEFLLGYKRPQMLRHVPADSPAHQRLVQRLHERSVVDC